MNAYGFRIWEGRVFFAHGRTNSCGVCILFRRDASSPITVSVADPGGRFLILQMKHAMDTITLLNVYAPTQSESREQIQLISDLQAELSKLEVHTLIMGGDFNLKMDQQSDNTQTNADRSSMRTSYATQLKALLEDYHLADVWKRTNPQSSRGTFHRGQYTARLDYFFIPEHLIPSQTKINIVPEPLSDHCALHLGLFLPKQERGPGFWRFNNQLLSDHIFTVKNERRSGACPARTLEQPKC